MTHLSETRRGWLHHCRLWLLIGALALASGVWAMTPPDQLSVAIAEQRRLVAEQPRNAAAFSDLGNLLILDDRPEAAQEAYLWALELDPSLLPAHFNLALLQQSRGQLDDALVHYRHVVELDVSHAWAYYQIGRLYEQKGKRLEAIDAYARAFSLDPNLAFDDVNPQVIDSRLVTQALLTAYRDNQHRDSVPRLYDDAARIANILLPTSLTRDGTPGSDAGATAEDARAAGRPPVQPAGTPLPPADDTPGTDPTVSGEPTEPSPSATRPSPPNAGSAPDGRALGTEDLEGVSINQASPQPGAEAPRGGTRSRAPGRSNPSVTQPARPARFRPSRASNARLEPVLVHPVAPAG